MAQNMASLIPFRSAIRWAVTGQETSEQLVQELKDINDGLYALLPPPYWKDVSRAVVEHLTSTEEWQLLHKFAVAKNSQNDAVYAMATNKEMVIRASSAVLSQLDLEELWISPMLVTVDTLSAVATTGTCSAPEGEVRVLIEWKRYKESLKSRPTDFKRLLTRVDNIAQTLHPMPKPEGFRTLLCLKFFDDTKEDRFGIVFETPPASDPLACPIQLRALYDQCKGDKQPLLRDKFRLASLIANSVCEFLCASWFHKSVNPHTILFFKNLEEVLDLCSPFLTGFEYSRLDQESEDTEPPDSDYL